MPCFYLHLCDGQAFSEAEEGQEYADLRAASCAAIEGLRDTLAGDLLKGKINLAAYVEIEDHEHHHVATVRFADAIRVSTSSVRPPRELA